MDSITVTREQLVAVLLKHGHADWDEFDAEVMVEALFQEFAPSGNR